MAVGNYSKRRKEYLSNKLKSARDKIKEFPIINKIVDNFNHIDPDDSINNPLVFLAASANYDIFYRCPNPMTFNFLKQIEEGLSLIDIFKISSGKRNYIISRLKSNKSDQVLSVISEINLFLYFIKKMGRENVTIEPKLDSGKRPELKLEFNGLDVYIEQTNVDEGIVERKIEEVFYKASKKIWNLINRKITLQFNVNTSKLIWNSDGHLDIEESVKKIVNSIKNLNLFIFFDIEKTYFRLESLTRLTSPDKCIIEQKNILQYYDEIGKILSKNINNEPFKSFCEKTKIQDIINSPIVSFISGPARYRLVEVQSHDMYPSQSSLAQKEGFIKRICKNIKQKMEESQREPNKPNLLFVKASHWTVHRYSYEDEIIADIVFEPILTGIKDLLSSNIIDDLSAIILYEDEPSKGRIIINEHVKDKSRLSIEDIQKIIT